MVTEGGVIGPLLTGKLRARLRLCMCCDAQAPEGVVLRFRDQRACSWRCLAHMATGGMHR